MLITVYCTHCHGHVLLYAHLGPDQPRDGRISAQCSVYRQMAVYRSTANVQLSRSEVEHEPYHISTAKAGGLPDKYLTVESLKEVWH